MITINEFVVMMKFCLARHPLNRALLSFHTCSSVWQEAPSLLDQSSHVC